MKKILTCFLVAVTAAIWGPAADADAITADFESQSIPAGWTTTGTVTVKKDNNSYRAALGTNATLTSPAVTGATSVTYRHRGSGNNKELAVDCSTDGGLTWSAIGSVKVSSSSSYGSGSHVIPRAESPVIVRFTCKSATIYVDDIAINYVATAPRPAAPGTIALESAGGSTLSFNLTPGDGEGRVVAIAEGDAMPWTPADGATFDGKLPATAGDGNVSIIACGDVTAATATGLRPGTRYTVAVWEYNGDGEARAYLTDGAATLSVSTLTVPTLAWGAATVDFMNTKVGGDGKTRTVGITGNYLEPADGTVTVTSAADCFTVSADGVNWGPTATLPYTGSTLNATIHITFSPEAPGKADATLTATAGAATATLALTGKGSDSDAREIYIAPDGDDNLGDGTADAPWLNLQKAVNEAQPGDIIYCRGGRYHFTWRDSSGKLTVRLKKSGTPDAPITIMAVPGEFPIFDFEQQLIDCNRDRSKVGDRGMQITGDWWVLYGLHITHAADNGIKLEGSHNRIERCEFSYNLDSGLQMGFGHDFSASGLGSKNDGSFCAYNDIIDCDSHHNCDFDTNYGSDADGFACKMHNGEGNRFIRCRAWRNSDDAWDLYETDFSVTLVECWAWHSGKAEDHTWVYDYFDRGSSFSGNGNGIKLGGNGSGGSSRGVHYAYKCIAFGCDKSGSTKGFDCNSHKDGHVIIGGLAFDNGYDFMFESGGSASSRFHNNVCFGRQEILVGTESHNALGITPNPGKTFVNNVVTDFSRADYVSLDEADALAPRGADGSMPARFARLKPGSKLVDAGTWHPLPYGDEFPFLDHNIYGAAPDMGPYELASGNINTGAQMIVTDTPAAIFEIVSATTSGVSVRIAVDTASAVTIDVVDVAGRKVATVDAGRLEAGAVYNLPLNVDIASAGVYFFTARTATATTTARAVVR